MSKLNQIDAALLRALQRDAQLTTQQLSELLNLSASQIGRRKARLEQEGYIANYMARAAPDMLGLNVQAFVQVQMTDQTLGQTQSFLQLTQQTPEITAAWTLTGEADYLLRVYCADLAALNLLVQKVLLPHPAIARVQSQIVMEQLKADGPLPI